MPAQGDYLKTGAHSFTGRRFITNCRLIWFNRRLGSQGRLGTGRHWGRRLTWNMWHK